MSPPAGAALGREGMTAMVFKRAGFMTKLVVLALLIYMAISLIDMRGKIQSVQDQRDDLARQVTDQQLENQKLADAVANSDDPEMLERVVRDRGYVERAETVFIDIAN